MSSENPHASSQNRHDALQPHSENALLGENDASRTIDSAQPDLKESPPLRNKPDGFFDGESEGATSFGQSRSTVPTGRIGCSLIAWLVILTLVMLIALRPLFVPPEREVIATAAENSLGLRLMEIQSKYLVGASELPSLSNEQLYDSVKQLNSGTLDQRLRFVVVAGELAGATEARAQLKRLETKLARSKTRATEEQHRLHIALERLYADYAQNHWDAPSLKPHQRQLLQRRLGWFGALALAPSEGPNGEARAAALVPARRTVAVIILAALAAIGLTIAGSVGLTIFLAMALSGSLRLRMRAGSKHADVYVETFALWMVLFIALSTTASMVASEQRLLDINFAVFFLSLSALVWPVLRGVPWQRVRDDLGWTRGSGIAREPLWGLVCYASTLPLLVMGVLVMILLMSFAGLLSGEAGLGDDLAPVNLPSHPVVEWIGEASWWDRLLIFLLACVAAPLVEETMFRGVLYRYLRDRTASWRVGTSVLFSGAVASFLFAVIHPQGVLAVPVLTSLAFGFSLAREWRGSLLAPITMHAVNNGAATLVMLAIF